MPCIKNIKEVDFMAMVVKRGGKLQAFNIDKVKHAVSAAYADAKDDLIREVARSVSASVKGRKEVKARVIRDKIVKKLDSMAPIVSRSWRRYEKRRK